MRMSPLSGGRICLLALMLGGGPAASAAPLACLGEQLPGLRAEFHQIVRTEAGDILQEKRGLLEALPPKRLRWEVTVPAPELLLADGQSLWHYQPDLSQAVRYSLQPASPLFLLLGGADAQVLAEKYQVQSVTGPDGFPVHRFAAREEESGDFSRFELAFAAGCLPRLLSWEDPLGQRAEIHFQHAARTRPDVQRFRFVLPPGAALAEPGA